MRAMRVPDCPNRRFHDVWSRIVSVRHTKLCFFLAMMRRAAIHSSQNVTEADKVSSRTNVLITPGEAGAVPKEDIGKVPQAFWVRTGLRRRG
jgi:hypothetical protein